MAYKQMMLYNTYTPMATIPFNKGWEDDWMWDCLFNLAWDIFNSFQYNQNPDLSFYTYHI